MKYYLYIIQTVDNNLYCGISSNPLRRFREHKTDNKKGAKYFKMHPAKEIIYIDELEDKSSALKEEYRIKKTLTRKEKLELIKENKQRTQKFLQNFS